MKDLSNLTDKELLRRTKLAEHNKNQMKKMYESYLEYVNKEINKYNEEYYRRRLK